MSLPGFNPRRVVLAENGGGSALCSVRGGGELGEAWRLGGMGTTRSTRGAEEADIAAFVFGRAGVPAWQPGSADR